MAQVTVEVGGRSYRLTCDEGQQEHVISLARRLDGHATAIEGSRTPANEARIVVMAALMMADELFAAEATRDALQADVTALRRSGAGGAPDEQVAEMERAMADMLNRAADQIETVTGEIEELS